MKTKLTKAELAQLVALTTKADELEAQQESLHQEVRRLLECSERDGEAAAGYIFDMVFNGEEVDDTLGYLGVEVEP